MKDRNSLKKKLKGFTLIELIVVIAIIGSLALLIVPKISNWLSKGRGVYYQTLEKEMSLLAKDYYVTNNKELPVNLNETKILTTGILVKDGYINEVFKDFKEQACNNSFAVIKNQGNKKYEYIACLMCDDYESENSTCVANKSSAPYVNSVNKKHQVLTEITIEEIHAIKDSIITKGNLTGVTREDITIDTEGVNVNLLGNYVFYYSVPSKDIYGYEGLIKVVDEIDPVIHGDSVVTQKGLALDLIESLKIDDNYYSYDDLTITYQEVDVVDINTIGDYQVIITAKDPSGNEVSKGITVSVFDKIATFSPNSVSWTPNSITTTITLEDLGLTINSWSYQIGALQDGTTTWGNAVAGTGTSGDVTITDDGISTIKVTVVYADRTLSQTSGQYKKDSTEPECGAITGGSTNWINTDRTISIGCSDTISSCKQTSYSNTFTNTTKVGNITIENNAGLTKSCPINVYVDKDKPTCGTISTLPANASSNNWTNNQRQVSIECSDEDSKCVTNTYTETYTSTMATGTITIRDNATNSATCNIPIYVDKINPSCQFLVNSSGVHMPDTSTYRYRTDEISGVAAFGMKSTNIVEYNSVEDMALAVSYYYGFIKDKAENVDTCGAEVVAKVQGGSCTCSDVLQQTCSNSRTCPTGYTRTSGTCTNQQFGSCYHTKSIPCASSSLSCPSGYSLTGGSCVLHSASGSCSCINSTTLGSCSGGRCSGNTCVCPSGCQKSSSSCKAAYYTGTLSCKKNGTCSGTSCSISPVTSNTCYKAWTGILNCSYSETGTCSGTSCNCVNGSTTSNTCNKRCPAGYNDIPGTDYCYKLFEDMTVTYP